MWKFPDRKTRPCHPYETNLILDAFRVAWHEIDSTTPRKFRETPRFGEVAFEMQTLLCSMANPTQAPLNTLWATNMLDVALEKWARGADYMAAATTSGDPDFPPSMFAIEKELLCGIGIDPYLGIDKQLKQHFLPYDRHDFLHDWETRDRVLSTFPTSYLLAKPPKPTASEKSDAELWMDAVYTFEPTITPIEQLNPQKVEDLHAGKAVQLTPSERASIDHHKLGVSCYPLPMNFDPDAFYEEGAQAVFWKATLWDGRPMKRAPQKQ